MPNEIVHSDMNSGLAPADWMQPGEAAGVDSLRGFQTRPRISIVQGQSGSDRKNEFGEGATILMPDGIMVAGALEGFVAVPILFWPTWETWSDINDTSKPMVEEVSTNPASEVAAKSRARETRLEPYGTDGEFKRKHVEVMNYIVLVDSGEAKGELAIMSFASGELYNGKKLNKLIARRADKFGASIYDNRIQFTPALRERNNREWFGWDFDNPAEGEGEAMVQDKATHDKLAEMHDGAKRSIDAGQIGVVRDENADTDNATDGDLPPI